MRHTSFAVVTGVQTCALPISVRQSMEEHLKAGGWTVATNQISPLGTTDFSSYLLNVANSGADVVININFGRDAVLSIKQAKDFGIIGKMKLAVPFISPFLAKEVGPEIMEGVFAATDYWWTLEETYPRSDEHPSELQSLMRHS